jgi:hypothetical protein
VSDLFDSAYTAIQVRFWRVPTHREALEVLAEATTQSSEADFLSYEWGLIQLGNRAEFNLRREWALSPAAAGGDLVGWRYTETWEQISTLYGPHHDRHRADLCKWLHGRKYPVSVGAHGGAGDAGGRARRIIADLDWARARVPNGLSEHELEKAMAICLGWQRPSEIRTEGAA